MLKERIKESEPNFYLVENERSYFNVPLEREMREEINVLARDKGFRNGIALLKNLLYEYLREELH